MKTVLLAAGCVALLAACDKPADLPPASAIPQEKTITLRLAQARDYSDAQYDGVEAELRVAVSKVNKSTGANTVVWDTLVPFQSLRQYPAASAPWLRTKVVTVADDFREGVSASYSVRFRDAENRLSSVGKNEFANNGNTSLLFDVKL